MGSLLCQGRKTASLRERKVRVEPQALSQKVEMRGVALQNRARTRPCCRTLVLKGVAVERTEIVHAP
ncbi:hypothetical protein KPSA1_06536 [Pseudomonas syringae pv. actinidiae]|nr:hypothetical protein KPSA1_06536 [Pseudomonas syringae pv. actinidiae]